MTDVQENPARNFIGYVRLPDVPCTEDVWRTAEREAREMGNRKIDATPEPLRGRLMLVTHRVDDWPDGRMVQVIVGEV